MSRALPDVTSALRAGSESAAHSAHAVLSVLDADLVRRRRRQLEPLLPYGGRRLTSVFDSPLVLRPKPQEPFEASGQTVGRATCSTSGHVQSVDSRCPVGGARLSAQMQDPWIESPHESAPVRIQDTDACAHAIVRSFMRRYKIRKLKLSTAGAGTLAAAPRSPGAAGMACPAGSRGA